MHGKSARVSPGYVQRWKRERQRVLVLKVWLGKVVKATKVNRESRREVFVQNQRCSEALT